MRTIRKCFLALTLLASFGTALTAQIEVGVTAPEFQLEEVYGDKSLMGTSLTDLRGQVIVLDFWAIWCTPCVSAIPKLNELQREYGDRGVRFLAVTDDPAQKLENFLADANFELPVVRAGSKSAFTAYQVLGRPQYYLINRDGRVVYSGHGIDSRHIEEVLATNGINQPAPVVPEAIYDKEVITYGNYRLGEDPTYNGVREMLALPALDDDRFLSQFVLRPSLPGMGMMYGHSTSSRPPRVGVTYPNAPLPVLLAYVKQLTSALWIENRTGDTTEYDLIYSKAAPNLETAFAEIESQLLDDLYLQLTESHRTDPVRYITLGDQANRAVKERDIPEGSERTYHSVKFLLSQLEEREGRRAMAHPEIADLYVHDPELNLRKVRYPTVEMIEALLQYNGLQLTVEERPVTVYVLERLTITGK